MLQAGNQVAIIGSHLNNCHYIYPKEVVKGPKPVHRQQDGQYEVFYELEVTVREKVKEIVKEKSFVTSKDVANTRGGGNYTSCLASALSRALCYINRKEKELQSGEKLDSRILVISGSSESSAQYMAFMNAFFTAQKQGVTIDACVLGPYATLLGQGADLTGGIYLKPPQIPGLLQYLMWIFLPDVSMRKKLALPPQEPVDYRAACFCHRHLIEQGFVCSVCLSIFCKFSPICTTCHAVFKAPPMPAKIGKKKTR
ncbi:unnamed protein product [Allacma fusca]|uniref:General transcription factor IIH subunit 3 n=1 Tax=Allacma fusca TaxID=39272 RepID=A0A8J2JCK0_9HEXA|nr:unnamed protein product [Allacma fusca]